MQGTDQNDERILVVDDEPLTCTLLEELLTLEGYKSVLCSRPDEALRESEKQRFALAFIDINLPGMNGLELASLLRKRHSSCEFVFITGYGTIENAVEAIKFGAYDFLRKPFSIAEIALCLERFREWKALKERIASAEQRYGHLVENVPLIIYVLRRDYRLSFANRSCLSMLGYTSEEAMDAPGWFLERVYPDDRERIRNKFEAAFESRGTPFSTECRMLHKAGHVIHTIIKSISYSEPAGDQEADCLEGIIIDITDRVLLEKAAVQREKLRTLSAMAAEVAHEIRNPLVSIGGFARRLEKQVPALPEVAIILRESERLELVLERIRNHMQSIEVSPRQCSVNRIVMDCMDLLSSEGGKKQLRCRLNLDSHLQTIQADPDILRQVFLILIRNAIAAKGEDGELTIETLENDQGIQIEFEYMMQGQWTDECAVPLLPIHEEGESVEVPMCRQMVENMGGQLTFVDRQHCVIFTVSLPH
jgi:PAS domain S-box-containing protein